MTNKVAGLGSSSFGRMDLSQITAKYSSKPAKIIENVLLLRLKDTFRYNMRPSELYDITRGVWIVAEDKRKIVDYAFAVYDGVIQETYEILAWYEAGSTLTSSVIKEAWKKKKRWEFIGNISEELQKKYKYKSVEHYFKKRVGDQNPVRYINCDE